jgi:hypothetical protein
LPFQVAPLGKKLGKNLESNALLSFASGSRLIEIYKGDLVGNIYESLLSAGYQLGYYNRAKELLTPESHYGVSMLQCTYHASKKGSRTHCPVSTFQFLKFDGEMMHCYTQCSKGISKSS